MGSSKVYLRCSRTQAKQQHSQGGRGAAYRGLQYHMLGLITCFLDLESCANKIPHNFYILSTYNMKTERIQGRRQNPELVK